ncbi:MAG TPA: hypothetical protein VFU46_14110 [Gemmatimonadales bacterium]|nr:hypothetical protein [Gemmatimonadales bacterium]
MITAVLIVQGVFYVVTGLWPFLHLPSFITVVGAKPDIFQLHVTAGLIVAIGLVLLLGARRPDPSAAALGILAALTFIALDVAYDPVLRQIYWLDAAAEALIALLLIAGVLARRKSR